VDFVVPRRGRPPLLAQFCETLADPGTRKRETGALAEAMAALRVRQATLVTRNESGSVDVASGTVEVVPVWKFLLEDAEPEA